MNIILIEPERLNNLVRWWMQPQSAELIGCLEKAYQATLIEATDLQAKSEAESNNGQFAQAAKEKLKESADLQITLRTLKSFFPDGPFIARIEL